MQSLRCRKNTCKLITLTSLIWIFLDIVFLISYSDCPDGFGYPCPSQHKNAKKESLIITKNDFKIRPSYPRHLLHSWTRAKVVVKQGNNLPGEMGKAVKIPQEKEEEKKEKFKINQFNLLASEMISLNRSLRDVRLEQCKDKEYPSLLPATSIIIVFHNEAWTTLLRTIHSIINRSPPSLLHEIILVDDASQHKHLGEELEDYVASLSVTVKIYRTGVRSGLIRARLLGAAHAQGAVLTFLDAHCECTEGWLEPLLAQIANNRNTVVCPVIDVISDETFEYVTASDMTWGGFNWKLNFRWYRAPKRELERRNNDRSEPLQTPAMAGGLFSIDREYFYWIGAYDPGMEVWGGENLEMSFRVWMCGGRLLIATCSHVGHVFRKSTPYTFPGGTSRIVNHNNARLAQVWLDDWKDFYFSINPAARTVDIGNITDRLSLRSRLECKSFHWYLSNIYPESQMPLDYHYLGEVRNKVSNNCLDTMGRKAGGDLGVSFCHGLGGNQVFSYTKRQQLMSDDNCLDANGKDAKVKLVRCHGLGGNQAWIYDGHVRHVNTGQCLAWEPAHANPALEECKDGEPGQDWLMEDKFKWQHGKKEE